MFSYVTTATDNNSIPINIKHLCSKNQWQSGLIQATDIPAPELNKIKETARKAFLSIQLFEPLPLYSNVYQSPDNSNICDKPVLALSVQHSVEDSNNVDNESCLDAELTGIVVTPTDLDNLAKCVTGITKYELWKIKLENLLQNALPNWIKNITTAKNNSRLTITIESQCSEILWQLDSTQATNSPVPEEASTKLPDPLPPHPKILQRTNKPYALFVEQLITSIASQIKKGLA